MQLLRVAATADYADYGAQVQYVAQTDWMERMVTLMRKSPRKVTHILGQAMTSISPYLPGSEERLAADHADLSLLRSRQL